MSDTDAEAPQGTNIDDTMNSSLRRTADTGPIGNAGESYFAAEAMKAGNEANPDTSRARAMAREDEGFKNFMADQQAAAEAHVVRQRISTMQSGPVSEAMQRERDRIAAVHDRQATAQPSRETPTIVLGTTWQDNLKARFIQLKARLGFGKKQEPVKQ